MDALKRAGCFFPSTKLLWEPGPSFVPRKPPKKWAGGWQKTMQLSISLLRRIFNGKAILTRSKKKNCRLEIELLAWDDYFLASIQMNALHCTASNDFSVIRLAKRQDTLFCSKSKSLFGVWYSTTRWGRKQNLVKIPQKVLDISVKG